MFLDEEMLCNIFQIKVPKMFVNSILRIHKGIKGPPSQLSRRYFDMQGIQKPGGPSNSNY